MTQHRAPSDPADYGVEPGDVDSDTPAAFDPDTPYNAGDREHVKAKARTKKALEKDRDYVLTALMSDPNGRDWLAHILFEVCGMNAPLQDAEFRTEAVHFREGSRRVAILLQAQLLRVNRKLYMLLLEEHLRG